MKVRKVLYLCRGLVLGAAAFSSIAVLSSIACSTSESAPVAPPTEAGLDKSEIVIGVTLPLTGDLASLGKGQNEATKVAEAQLNARGGVLGRTITFRILDDATDVNTAVANATDFINQGLPAVIGPSQSAQANNVVPLLFGAKVIEISSSVTSDDFTTAQPAKDRYFLRTVPPFAVQSKALAAFARNGPAVVSDAGAPDGGAARGCTNMALVHYDESFGNAFRNAYRDNFVALGGVIVIDVPVAKDPRQSYTDEVAKIIAARPLVECVGLIATPQIGATFMRDYRAGIATDVSRDWSLVYVAGHNGLNKTDFITLGRVNAADPNSPTSAEGVYGTNIDTNPPRREFSDFRNLYTARYPLPDTTTPPPGNSANQYDAAILLALAIQHAGTATDKVKIRDALFSVSKDGKAYGPAQIGEAFAAIEKGDDIDYSGASGAVDFDDYGNVVGDFIIWKVENGKFKTVQKVSADSLK